MRLPNGADATLIFGRKRHLELFGRRMHLECSCGSNVFKNEWVYDNFTGTYTYTCNACNRLNVVDYPAHHAAKKEHRIIEVLGLDLLTDTLTIQDDHSVVMDLKFDPNAMCQLMYHLNQASLEVETASEIRQLVYTIIHDVPPKYDEAGHALAKIITKKVNEQLNQLTTLPKKSSDSTAQRVKAAVSWNITDFDESAVEHIVNKLTQILITGINIKAGNMNNWPYIDKNFCAYWDTFLLRRGKLGFFGWIDIWV